MAEMLAIRVTRQDPADPLAGLSIQRIPVPQATPGWELVRVCAAPVNPHDLWTLRGVGVPANRLPLTLGSDGCGIDSRGNSVIIYPTLGNPEAGDGDITMDPERGMLGESENGTLAEYVLVPKAHLIPQPAELTALQSASMLGTFGTAFRMLFTRGGLTVGQSVLVQGATGGVASAAIALARAAGATVYASSRSTVGRRFAESLGARAVSPGAHLPERVDLVLETVGQATWSHSMRAVRRGGTVVVAGATTGDASPAELRRLFFHQISVVGSLGCTLEEFSRSIAWVVTHRIMPPVARVFPLDRVHDAFRTLQRGGNLGKIVVSFGEASDKWRTMAGGQGYVRDRGGREP